MSRASPSCFRWQRRRRNPGRWAVLGPLALRTQPRAPQPAGRRVRSVSPRPQAWRDPREEEALQAPQEGAVPPRGTQRPRRGRRSRGPAPGSRSPGRGQCQWVSRQRGRERWGYRQHADLLLFIFENISLFHFVCAGSWLLCRLFPGGADRGLLWSWGAWLLTAGASLGEHVLQGRGAAAAAAPGSRAPAQ